MCLPFFPKRSRSLIAETEYRLADRGLLVTSDSPVMKVLTWVSIREQDIKETRQIASRKARKTPFAALN